MRLRDLPIRYKLMGISMVTTLAALVSSSVVFLTYDYYASRQGLLDELSTLAETMAANLTTAIVSNDREMAGATLGSLAWQPDIVGATVLSRSGELLALHGDGSLLPPPLPSDGHLFLDGSLALSRAITFEDTQVGSLLLTAQLDRVVARSRRFGGILALVMLGVSGLAFVLSSWLQKLVSSPVVDLVAAQKRVAETQDYRLRLPARSRDELGLLVAGFNGMLEAIEEREAALVHDALHDALTGLPNRSFLATRLGHALDLSKRKVDYRFALLYVDLDRFKVVNDSLGHLAGDRLLAEVGRRLAACSRDWDTVARLGGDEFAVLLEEVEPDAAIRFTERILAALREPFEVGEQRVVTTASVGIALGDFGYHRPEDVLRDADIAMYRAKATGKDRFAVFDAEMHARAVKLLDMEISLRRALERGELRVHYQPIVELETRRIVGFEALLRWEHPQRGIFYPAEFLGVAEDSGLIVPIGRWLLSEACGRLADWRRRWPRMPGILLCVNLSVREISEPDLVDYVEEVLSPLQGGPDRLGIELTEQAIMAYPEVTMEVTKGLGALGVELAIDDFGAGYSSLSRLQALPFQTLKIDRSFVQEIAGDGGRIVHAVVGLARDLGMSVIAEGVETEAHLDRLKAFGCSLGQGYYFAPPLPPSAAAQLVFRSPQASTSQARGAG
jgi:diguanylate cyclase (GGDEF)-like protein